MNGTVVCGVDFSANSAHALRWAAWLARQSHAPLVVAHAIDPLLADAADLKYGAGSLLSTLRRDLESFVTEALAGQPVPRLRLGRGTAVDLLLDEAAACQAGAIVVGKQGIGTASPYWFGSTTMRVLRASKWPVLVLPPRTSAPPETAPSIAEIVVGIDPVWTADTVRAIGSGVGRFCQAPITGLLVVPTLPVPTGWSALIEDVTADLLRSAEDRLAAQLPDDWTRVVRPGDPARELVAQAGQHALIVVGLGHPGSTTTRILHLADVPVLAVPVGPGAARGGSGA